MTRIRKALVPLLLGCAGGLAHSQPGVPAEETARRFAFVIDAASRRHGVDGALVHAVIFAESSYDPLAVSAQGALGLMQLMPETARRYGVRNALDPAQNVDGGVRMLKDLLEQFDQDMELALAAYNSGPNAVIRAGYRVPDYDETLAFVPRVLGYYRAYQTIAEPAHASGDAAYEPAAPGDALRRAIKESPAPRSVPADSDGSGEVKRQVAIAPSRRQRKRAAARIFGCGAAGRLPEPCDAPRGHTSVEAVESPIVALTTAAGQKDGLHEEGEKPSRPGRSKAAKAQRTGTTRKATTRAG